MPQITTDTVEKEKVVRGEAEAEAGAGADKGTTFDEPANSSAITEKHDLPTASTTSASTVVGDDEQPAADNAPSGNAAPEPVAPESTRTTAQTAIIMAALGVSVFLAALDTTIVTTALPTISEYFGSSAGYTWIGSAYLLANAASTPSWGKFSDIWGRKPILLCAAGIFFLGSVLAGASISIGMLIVARAVQGIGGGGLIVLVNITISDLFSMRKRGTYFGIIGMVWAFASAVGPILGGVFTEKGKFPLKCFLSKKKKKITDLSAY
jgi:hypothetical protein